MRSVHLLLSLCAAAACGDDGEVGQLPDARPTGDAAVTPDTSPSMVSLTVRAAGQPVADVPVYFQNADSSLVAQTVTDAHGVASTTMAAGGFVTALDPFPPRGKAGSANQGVSSSQIYTFSAVEPGDALQLTDVDGPRVTVNFTVPTTTDATGYRVYTTCSESWTDISGGGGSGSGAPGGQVSLRACGTGDVVVEALDPNGIIVGTIFKTNVTVADQITVDLSAESYVAPASRVYRYTNIPEAFSEVFLMPFSATSRGLLVESAANIGFELGAGMRALVGQAPDPALLSVVQSTFNTVAFGQQNVVEWGPSTTAEYVLDGSSLFLPTIDGRAAFDLATAKLTWTETATGEAPDFALANIGFGREGGGIWNWNIVAPHATQITLPTLVGEAAVFNPTSTDAAFPDGLVLAKVPGGYDAARPYALDLLSSPHVLIAGPSGRAVVERYVDISTFGRFARRALLVGPAPRN